MYDFGAFEFLVWMFCAGLVLDASRYPSDTAVYIATTGMALASLAFSYTIMFHAGKLNTVNASFLHRLVATWLALTSGALAITHCSNFLGYVSVFGMYASIGFHVARYSFIRVFLVFKKVKFFAT